MASASGRCALALGLAVGVRAGHAPRTLRAFARGALRASALFPSRSDVSSISPHRAHSVASSAVSKRRASTASWRRAATASHILEARFHLLESPNGRAGSMPLTPQPCSGSLLVSAPPSRKARARHPSIKRCLRPDGVNTALLRSDGQGVAFGGQGHRRCEIPGVGAGSQLRAGFGWREPHGVAAQRRNGGSMRQEGGAGGELRPRVCGSSSHSPVAQRWPRGSMRRQRQWWIYHPGAGAWSKIHRGLGWRQ